MLLSANTHALEIVLAGAVATTELDWFVAYADKASNVMTPGSSSGVTTGATSVQIVAPPAASHQIKITFLSIWNTDTASATVSVRRDVSGTNVMVYKATLATGEQLVYIDERGFVVYADTGLEKTSAGGGGGDALTSDPLSQFAATTSTQLRGVISDETGTGALVFADTPTLVTPILGTPTSGTLTNCTGLPTAGLVNDAVTYAKIQNVSAASRLLGRGSAGGSGDVEELTIGSGLTLTGTALSASGGVSIGKVIALRANTSFI